MNIQQDEALCAKVYEQVSHAWEALMDDVEMKEIKEKLHAAESSLVGLRTSLKYLSPDVNMSKDFQIKLLQQ